MSETLRSKVKERMGGQRKDVRSKEGWEIKERMGRQRKDGRSKEGWEVK